MTPTADDLVKNLAALNRRFAGLAAKLAQAARELARSGAAAARPPDPRARAQGQSRPEDNAKALDTNRHAREYATSGQNCLRPSAVKLPNDDAEVVVADDYFRPGASSWRAASSGGSDKDPAGRQWPACPGRRATRRADKSSRRGSARRGSVRAHVGARPRTCGPGGPGLGG